MSGEEYKPKSPEEIGESLAEHLRRVEGTPEGEPSNEPVPVFPKENIKKSPEPDGSEKTGWQAIVKSLVDIDYDIKEGQMKPLGLITDGYLETPADLLEEMERNVTTGVITPVEFNQGLDFYSYLIASGSPRALLKDIVASGEEQGDGCMYIRLKFPDGDSL